MNNLNAVLNIKFLLNKKMSTKEPIHLMLYSFIQIFFLSRFFIVNSTLLNNIIIIAGQNYRYSHFSIDMNGDIVIDSTTYPESNTRSYYGITKNGKGFFLDASGNKTYHKLLETNGIYKRYESESIFIRITSSLSQYKGKEMFLSISNVDSSAEIVDFSSGIITFSSKIYGGYEILISNVFSIIESPRNSDSEFIYYVGSITESFSNNGVGNYYLNIAKLTYEYTTDYNLVISNILKIDASYQGMTSCFFTNSFLYICFYIQNEYQLTILISDLDKVYSSISTIYEFTEVEQDIFHKGIHLKLEIGFFAYFKSNENFPTFSLYKINGDQTISVYKDYKEIPANKLTCISNYILNDLIKFNDYTICFASSSENKEILYILVFSLYNEDNNMNIRYFSIELYQKYNTKILSEIRLGLYNNFLTMVFSHCSGADSTITCDTYDTHYSSLIFFNYGNSTDIHSDIIEYLFPKNKNIQTDIIINFDQYLNIENNLFGYILLGTKIIGYSEKIDLIKNGDILNNDSFVGKGENLLVNIKTDDNNNYFKGEYNIE